ncbi:hypothetical protein C8J57DRAFT_1234115 [Mycena rebaudengoi]|nr:hypothetical protein C8J57DRAFT_1234115 [Mycena rebaudengoi]
MREKVPGKRNRSNGLTEYTRRKLTRSYAKKGGTCQDRYETSSPHGIKQRTANTIGDGSGLGGWTRDAGRGGGIERRVHKGGGGKACGKAVGQTKIGLGNKGAASFAPDPSQTRPHNLQIVSYSAGSHAPRPRLAPSCQRARAGRSRLEGVHRVCGPRGGVRREGLGRWVGTRSGGKIPSMGLSTERYEALKTASTRFFTEKNYGFHETESAMAAVFGDDCSSIEAKAWSTYWSALSTAGEAMDKDEGYTVSPIPLLDGSMPDVEMTENNSNASGSQPTLSNELLHSDATDRQCEREERKRNGNQHGREKNPLGRGFDELMASAFIERSVINSVKEMKPMYYCIGCDLAVRNNSRKRNTSHMLSCQLQRDFPSTWSKFKNGVPASGSQVASGEADAPALGVKKRKLEDPSLGRVPIPGITTLLNLHRNWTRPPRLRQFRCPSYSVPDRSNFITYNLVVEAENAMVPKICGFVYLGIPLKLRKCQARRNSEKAGKAREGAQWLNWITSRRRRCQ